ncbi:MAG: hypothetical protein ACE5QW_05365 [Thermoplasmata archaeon]
MKGIRMTPDGKYEILKLRFKDFNTLPKSFLLLRDEDLSTRFQE